MGLLKYSRWMAPVSTPNTSRDLVFRFCHETMYRLRTTSSNNRTQDNVQTQNNILKQQNTRQCTDSEQHPQTTEHKTMYRLRTTSSNNRTQDNVQTQNNILKQQNTSVLTAQLSSILYIQIYLVQYLCKILMLSIIDE